MTDHKKLISWKLQRAMSEDLAQTLAADVLDALAAKGLVIQSADEADARVAAARREGMERAAVFIDAVADSLPSSDDAEDQMLADLLRVNYEACAAAIRADMESDDG